MEQNTPVRKIPISHGSLTGRHANFLGNGAIGFESSLERDFVTLMLFDPSVASVTEQPVRILYRDATCKDRHYTPDYLVHRLDQPSTLIEVKPSRFLTEDLEPKFRAGRSYAGQRGWTFQVWTEKEIRTPRLENARFLLPYRSQPVSQDYTDAVSKTMADGVKQTVADVIDELNARGLDRGEALAALWHMISDGTVRADLDHILDPQSHLWISEEVLNGHEA